MLKAAEDSATWYMVFFVALCILLVCFSTCLCCLWSSLQTAVNVIDASSDFLRDTFRVAIVPVVHFFIGVIVFFLWLGCFFCVLSMNKITASKKVPQFKELEWTKANVGLAAFMIFSVFWLLTFIENLANMIVILSSATYYFNNSLETKENQREAEVGLSIKLTYINHFGTVAIGSFIVGIVRFIKWTIIALCQWIEHCTAEGQNAVAKCFLGCVMCLIDCFERITEYITEGAYQYCAVTGSNFCSGAIDSMILKLKHLGEFGWTQFFASMFILIGKVACISCNVVLYYFVLHDLMVDTKMVKSRLEPAVIVGLMTYIMVSIFLGMFDTSANTMMTCYAIDNDVNNNNPRYGPKTFYDNVSKIKAAAANDPRFGKQTGTKINGANDMA